MHLTAKSYVSDFSLDINPLDAGCCLMTTAKVSLVDCRLWLRQCNTLSFFKEEF